MNMTNTFYSSTKSKIIGRRTSKLAHEVHEVHEVHEAWT